MKWIRFAFMCVCTLSRDLKEKIKDKTKDKTHPSGVTDFTDQAWGKRKTLQTSNMMFGFWLISFFVIYIFFLQICLMTLLRGESVWTVGRCQPLFGGGMVQATTCVMPVDFTTRWTASTDLLSNPKDDWWVTQIHILPHSEIDEKNVFHW